MTSKHPSPPSGGIKVVSNFSQRRANLTTPPAPSKRLNHDLAEVKKRGVGSAPSSSDQAARKPDKPIRARGLRKKDTSPSPPLAPMANPVKGFTLQEEEEELNRMAMMKQLEREVGMTLTRQEANVIMRTRAVAAQETETRSLLKGEEKKEFDALLATTSSPRSLPCDNLLFDVEDKGRATVVLDEANARGQLTTQHTMYTRVAKFSKMKPDTLDTRPTSATARFVKTEKTLGKGAFGTVFEGYDEETGRFVAIKEVVFAGNSGCTEQKLQKITREVRLMKKLDHPHIVRYIAADRKGFTLCIYMELVSGGSLTSALVDLGTKGFPEKTARVYTRQICAGLAYLHSMGVAHRDIKGDNILLEKATANIKLADFNSSKQIGDLSINHGMNTLAGTPWYMAPEVIQGASYGLPADVWSLGITVIEMLLGQPPFVNDFENPHAAMFHIAQLQDPYPLSPELSPLACDFLGSAIVREPAQRHTVDALIKHPFVAELSSPKKATPKLQPVMPTGNPGSPRHRTGYEAPSLEGSLNGRSKLPSLPIRSSGSDLNLSRRGSGDNMFSRARKDPLQDLPRANYTPSPTHLRSSAKQLLEARLITALEYEKRTQQQQSLQVVNASLGTLN
eukprot:TRINITY_DN6036_c2_g1_i1.p1 TRINITY_DN6036_c2_g1~~TRINITY_DN6036_c2_g1_i1.p1  ORF type:complete len:621 (+),score=129.30 TRINITY_DN6036_c2_g1_i1:55-1917(+)